MKPTARRALRLLFRLAGVGFVVVVVAAGVALAAAWTALGRHPEGERQARIERSPQWQRGGLFGGHFENPQPLWNDYASMLSAALDASPDTSPSDPLLIAPLDPRSFDTPPASGLRVTWFGHSSTLVEIDGKRVLIDPVWSERASPFTSVGPKRWGAPPIALEQLPPIDAVVVSHDHYDHLDERTIQALVPRVARFIVPLGIGAHLEYWGVPPSSIVELDWWEKTAVGDVEVVCTPARHASGRWLPQNNTLWASWALRGPAHRVYFSGDTGLFPAMKDIGEKLGPFDLTMIEVGQYHRTWPDWHIGPEQAVVAHTWLRGKVMLPVHWGLFPLAYHAWTEPAERVRVAASSLQVDLALPRLAERMEPMVSMPQDRWWPDVPWQRAEEAPVVSTQVR